MINNYRVIIFDLDGTAIPATPDGVPSQRLIDVIARVRANSTVKLCAATGRALAKAKYIFDALSLTGPCVISAGTQIADPVTGEILWEIAIEPEDVQKALLACAPFPYEVLIGNEVFGEGAPAAERLHMQHANVMYVMDCKHEHGLKILALLEEIPGITAVGVKSWIEPDGLDIHITNKGATKEHAIAELLRILSILKEAAVGVGDANNDIHLFKSVGYKIAMGNATAQLKAKADEVCASVDDDGLVEIIERYCLK